MPQHRRNFLKLVGFSSSILLSSSDLFAYDDNEPEGFVINEAEQETYLIDPRRAPVTFMVDKSKSANSISLCREEIAPNSGIPVHKHLNEEEVICIQYGTGIFTLSGKEYEVKAGSSAYVPKGVWHGIRNTGTENLRMLFSFSPAGFENYFREIGVPAGEAFRQISGEEWAAINKKYSIVYKPR